MGLISNQTAVCGVGGDSQGKGSQGFVWCRLFSRGVCEEYENFGGG